MLQGLGQVHSRQVLTLMSVQLQLKIVELQAFLAKHRQQWQKVLDNQKDEGE
jgi:hypothetical protein